MRLWCFQGLWWRMEDREVCSLVKSHENERFLCQELDKITFYRLPCLQNMIFISEGSWNMQMVELNKYEMKYVPLSLSTFNLNICLVHLSLLCFLRTSTLISSQTRARPERLWMDNRTVPYFFQRITDLLDGVLVWRGQSIIFSVPADRRSAGYVSSMFEKNVEKVFLNEFPSPAS